MKFLNCVLLLFVNHVACSNGQIGKKSRSESEFVRTFSKCHRSSKNFDPCMKKALNDVRPYFKYGVPEFNISSFDPFFAEEVLQRRGGPNVNYILRLKNVYEKGWTLSKIYKFKSDLSNGYIRYYQWFPEKYLDGDWEFESNLVTSFANNGKFDLALYNYTQVTTVRRTGNRKMPFSVRVEAIDSGDLKLHIYNLLKGRLVLEQMLDRIINVAWRPGFHVLKPIIDDLVSTAFTKIFNDNFRNFPFDRVIPE